MDWTVPVHTQVHIKSHKYTRVIIGSSASTAETQLNKCQEQRKIYWPMFAYELE